MKRVNNFLFALGAKLALAADDDDSTVKCECELQEMSIDHMRDSPKGRNMLLKKSLSVLSAVKYCFIHTRCSFFST